MKFESFFGTATRRDFLRFQIRLSRSWSLRAMSSVPPGIHFGCQGLFSECYLDLPVERILSCRCGRAVRRNRVVEVCNLAATKPGQSLPFVRRVIEFVEMADAEWAIFTATRALRTLLQRGGINMIELARAEREPGQKSTTTGEIITNMIQELWLSAMAWHSQICV